MITRKQFYKSKQWEDFRKVIINQRTTEDGYVHCCRCGKPIINKYDLIIHHKQELSEGNVNDAMVALNPDNVECICFACHNKVHDRFGDSRGNTHRPVQKKVYIVYGAPASGKTSWVQANASADDLVVDMDSIWQMISINDRYDKPSSLKHIVFEVRDKLYDIIRYRSGNWHSAFVITGGALKGDRDRLMQRLGADDLIFIDASYEVCMARVKCKGLTDRQLKDWQGYIKDWFERYQPD